MMASAQMHFSAQTQAYCKMSERNMEWAAAVTALRKRCVLC